MKFFIVACLLVGASALHDQVIQAKWGAFKAKHGKQYHPSEEADRLKNFLEATVQIEEHNERFYRGEVSYELGHNEFSDLSDEEFRSSYLGRSEELSDDRFNLTVSAPMNPTKLPLTVDWRKTQVTPVKAQGKCGSCYAFAALGVVEALIKRTTGKEYDLSEQQIVDCSYRLERLKNNGCEGGAERFTLNYISREGVVKEKYYKYTSGKTGMRGKCAIPPREKLLGKGLKIRQHEKSEAALAEAVAMYGPILASLAGENMDFRRFRAGIYDNPACKKNPDHVISVVGYGTEKGRDYWIIKNSWGTNWGESGFGRIRRGVNQCGIASDFSHSVYF